MKVLQIAVGINGGGVGAVLLNYYKNMNHDNIRFDIVIDDVESVRNGSLLENDFKAMGCNIFRVTPKSVSLKENIRQVSEIIKNGNYDILHSNMEEWSALYCRIGKKYGIKTRIAHAHLAYVKRSFIKSSYYNVLRIALRHYTTDFFACSKDAGKYLFGDRIIRKPVFRVMPNAINVKNYTFNEEIRRKIRNEFSLSDSTFTVGFVGRLYYQKNPERLLRIFREITAMHPDSKLIIVGDYKSYSGYGGLVEYINANNLSDKVLFTGLRTDVADVMQGFDAFVLPSRYEGLGIVYVEAQASGLMTFATDKVVPAEVKCCELLHFIDGGKSDKYWADEVLKYSLDYKRQDKSQQVTDAGYEIKIEAEKLEKFYLEHC